jgi:nitrile hydratase
MNLLDTTATERAVALRDVLVEKGLINAGAAEEMAANAEVDWTDRNGARVVARAWTNEDFRRRLLADGTSACAEFGYTGRQGEYIVALENTDHLQNVIVCTLCSCTAWPVLGLPPDWYKSFEYRSRVVREARTVLREMGLELGDSVKIKVWDTTAETRYMVLPQRPLGTEGWSEVELASIVTKKSMVGVELIPAQANRASLRVTAREE